MLLFGADEPVFGGNVESTTFSRPQDYEWVMEGSIPLGDLPGGLNLQATVESGQSYLWERSVGDMYTGDGRDWYHTVIDGEVIEVRQDDSVLYWRSTTNAEPHLFRLLRLDDDLTTIRASAPADDVVTAALDRYWGLRVVSDPFFPTVISFVCSTQMRVERIYEMQAALREEYGDTITFQGRTFSSYPDPATLAAATETELREWGLGYRAPYVLETAGQVASGELTRSDIDGLPYEEARTVLTDYAGVGEKVADCVLLFSLSYLQAVPLDTWMQTVIQDYYPSCDKGSYTATSRALRETLGGEYAGYVQTYLFHYLRNQ